MNISILTLLMLTSSWLGAMEPSHQPVAAPVMILKWVGVPSLEELSAAKVGELASSGAYGSDKEGINDLVQSLDQLSPRSFRLVKQAIIRNSSISSEHVAYAPGPGIFSPDGTKIAYLVKKNDTIGVEIYSVNDHKRITVLKEIHGKELLPVWNKESTRLIRRFIPERNSCFFAQMWRVDSPAPRLERLVQGLINTRPSWTNETAFTIHQPTAVIVADQAADTIKMYDSHATGLIDKRGLHMAHYPSHELIHVIRDGRSALIKPDGQQAILADGIIKAFSHDGRLFVDYVDKGDWYSARVKDLSGKVLLELEQAFEQAFFDHKSNLLLMYDPSFQELFDLGQSENSTVLELESDCTTGIVERFLPDLRSFVRIKYDKKARRSTVSHHTIDQSLIAEWEFPQRKVTSVGFCHDHNLLILHDGDPGQQILLDMITNLATSFSTDKKCSSSPKKLSACVGRNGYYLDAHTDGTYELRRMIEPDTADLKVLIKEALRSRLDDLEEHLS